MLRVTVAYHRGDADELTLSNLRNTEVEVELINGTSLPTQMELRASLTNEDMDPISEGLTGGVATLIYYGRARMKLRVAPSILSSRDGSRFRLRLDVPEHPSLTAHSPAFKVVTKLAPGEGTRRSYESDAAPITTVQPASSNSWQRQRQRQPTMQDEATSGAVRPTALAEREQQSADVEAEVPTGSPNQGTQACLSELVEQFSRSASALEEPHETPPSLSTSQARSSLLGELLAEALKQDSTALLDDDTSGGLRNHFTLEELEAAAMAPSTAEEQPAETPRKSKEHAEIYEDISEGRRHEPRRHRVSA